MQPDELDALCDRIAELQVRRKFAISLANKQINAAKALIRRALGWKWDDGEEGREALNKRAGRIVDTFLAGKEQKAEDAELLGAFADDLAAVREALAPCERRRAVVEKEMVKAAKKLPVYEWQQSVHGFGEKALAIIVGEAGNLSRYDHDDKLKKRLGLAPYGGKAFSTWRKGGGLSADEWTQAGYAPRRRAEIHAVMEPLFRHVSEWKEKTLPDGSIRAARPAVAPYGEAYYRRRAHTAETHPDWKPAQSHADGLRIMTQKLVFDLWSEWRRAADQLPETAILEVPAAKEIA